jgi:hypothetical protein
MYYGEMRNSYNKSFRKPKGILVMPRRRWEDNIKMELMGHEDIDWTHRDQTVSLSIS